MSAMEVLRRGVIWLTDLADQMDLYVKLKEQTLVLKIRKLTVRGIFVNVKKGSLGGVDRSASRVEDILDERITRDGQGTLGGNGGKRG